MQWIVFIPVLIGSVIGLAYILMLLGRMWRLPLDRPELMNRVAQTIASGNREKALLMLDEDNHPSSILLSFAMKLSISNADELRTAYEYAKHEIRSRMTKGTSALAWLTIMVPIATGIAWLATPVKPPRLFDLIAGMCLIAEIAFWNITLFYVKFKIASILSRADDHFQFFSGLFMAPVKPKKREEEGMDIMGLIDSEQDVVDITDGLKNYPRKTPAPRKAKT